MTVQRVLIAADVDVLENVHVARPVRELSVALKSRVPEVIHERWEPEQGKGIDDLLAGGGKPREVAADVAEEELEEIVSRPKAQAAPPPSRDLDPPTPPELSIWPSPLQEEALHGIAGRLVRAIAPRTEADPAAILVQFLVGFGNLVGRGPFFLADGSHHHTNLFAVVVGKSSKARKGTSWAQARRPLFEVDPGWKDRVKSGLSSGEGLIFNVRDRVVETVPIKGKGGEIEGHEEEVRDPGVGDKRLLAVEQEFASVLRVAKRDGNTVTARLREGYDTGRLTTLTRTNPLEATGAHISIIGHITILELKKTLTRTETANGLGNRFLWVCARRSKILPEAPPIPEEELSPIIEEIREAVENARTIGRVRFAGDSREIWHKVYPILSDDRPGFFGEVTTRAEAQVIRLAMVYALLDGSCLIEAAHLRAALAVWTYCEDSARYIFSDSMGDELADEIRQVLKVQGRGQGLTRTELNARFGGHKSGSKIKRALETLRDAGIVEIVREPTGGRPRETIYSLEGAK